MPIEYCFGIVIMNFLVFIHSSIENTLKTTKTFEPSLKQPKITFVMLMEENKVSMQTWHCSTR